jgi:Fe-S-cluster containining protein
MARSLYHHGMGAEHMGKVIEPDGRFRTQDSAFVALVDGAFSSAAQRSGPHLLCRPGCTQCCSGVFAITPADALRLRKGFAVLQQEDPVRAARIQQRAAASWSRLAPAFPGNAASGILAVDENGDPAETFEDFANDERCPALDPEHGTCDVYAARPQTCRVFGPPVATGEGYGVCELCFRTANAEEIAKAAINPPAEELSVALDRAAIAAGEPAGDTVVAFVLKAGQTRASRSL